MNNFLNVPPAPSGVFQLVSSGADSFACCDKYRACSDSKHCIHPDSDFSIRCIYRRNLESGRVFYGKNSVFFSSSEYEDFLSNVHGLSSEVQAEFRSISALFVYWRMGSRRELLYATPGIVQMGEAGLLDLDSDPRKVLSIFNVRFLKGCFSEKEPPAKATRAEIIEILASQNPPSVQDIVKSLVYASVPSRLRTYYTEYYYDFVECEHQPPRLHLPLETDNPNILKTVLRTPLVGPEE